MDINDNNNDNKDNSIKRKWCGFVIKNGLWYVIDGNDLLHTYNKLTKEYEEYRKEN